MSIQSKKSSFLGADRLSRVLYFRCMRDDQTDTSFSIDSYWSSVLHIWMYARGRKILVEQLCWTAGLRTSTVIFVGKAAGLSCQK